MSLQTRRAIYGKLSGDGTLTGLLGTPATHYSQAIYFQQAPQGAGYPFVVFSRAAGTPTYTFKTGHATLDNEIWDIKAVDQNTTADRADAIAARLDALLTDGTLSISGATQLYLRRESDLEYLETTNDQTYRHSGSSYRLVIQPT